MPPSEFWDLVFLDTDVTGPSGHDFDLNNLVDLGTMGSGCISAAVILNLSKVPSISYGALVCAPNSESL